MITLKNRFLVASLSPTDGRLVHFARSDKDDSLLKDRYCQYYDDLTEKWYGGTKPDAIRDAFKLKSSRDGGHASAALSLHSPHLEVTIAYALPTDSPLLKVRIKVRGTGKPGKLQLPATPRIVFAPDFVNTFVDDQDLYFDGAELGGGRELPCWRVFFRKGHRDGLLLATRNKKEMSRFEIVADGFELRPHTFFNYSTTVAQFRPAFDSFSRKLYEAEFEIGPWEKSRHNAILRAAKLNEPVRVKHPPAKGRPKSRLKGKVFHATTFASRCAVSKAYHPKKWMIAKMPWAQKGRALFANAGVRPPPVLLNPKLKGLHRVFVGVGNGAGATLRISGEPETRYRLTLSHSDTEETPFVLSLSARHRAVEADFGVHRLDGKTLRIGRYPDTHQPSVIDYVRFEKLSPAEIARWEQQEKAKPCIPLCGHNDVPDIATITDARDPDPRAYAANIWEHANCKFDKIFWRIDGQCSDYPSRVNTMRYISARVHGVFNPQAKAYGRVLKKVDMLQLAVDAAKKYGVKLYGWMRFNSYMGNVQSDFYENNPQFWEEWEYGRKGGKLCLAFPEVRKHKIDILVEAAGYGLDGVHLGFLRHPPVLLYAEVMREAYKREYGKEPPRDPKHPDSHHVKSLPDRGDPEYLRWWKFRSRYLTQFGRELRAALRKKGLGHVKIVIWVRPNHCLFDGIDMEAWLNEGLCDEVVSDFYAGCDDLELYWERPDWKKMVQSKAKLIRGIGPHIEDARRLLPRILQGGYDGLCTYESDYTVIDSEWIEFYRSLRK